MTAHLIHIGYAKTGSTFLKRWFEAHPQIAFDANGIAGFRDVNDMARQSASPPSGMRLRVTSSEGFATPHAFIGGIGGGYHGYRDGEGRLPDAQAPAADMLAALFPDAHVLLVTRGFRSVVLSGYSQYVRDGGSRDFFAPDPADPEARRYAWNYDYLVRLYRERFGDRLIVLPYELLRDDAEAFVREIERPLGLDHCAPPPHRHNPSLSPVELRWYPRLTRLIRRLPIGDLGRRALLRIYLPLVMRNRLGPLVRLLQATRPAEPVTRALVTDEVVDDFRGRAEVLRDHPLYRRYRDDYLL
jgi:hypothetical protein